MNGNDGELVAEAETPEGRVTLHAGEKLLLGTPLRRRKVFAIRSGIDAQGIARNGFHWVAAARGEAAARAEFEEIVRRARGEGSGA